MNWTKPFKDTKKKGKKKKKPAPSRGFFNSCGAIADYYEREERARDE